MQPLNIVKNLHFFVKSATLFVVICAMQASLLQAGPESGDRDATNSQEEINMGIGHAYN